jgi:hypothetical protein
MACRTIGAAPGVTVIACTRGQRTKPCKACGGRATQLCDFPLAGPKAGTTCDAPLCKAHAYSDPQGRKRPDGQPFELCRVHHELELRRGEP